MGDGSQVWDTLLSCHLAPKCGLLPPVVSIFGDSLATATEREVVVIRKSELVSLRLSVYFSHGLLISHLFLPLVTQEAPC